MNEPAISGITLAFGNRTRLQEAIACFLAQDYSGPKELVVLNSAPQQTLSGNFNGVRIVNLRHRPPSLGATRNEAIKHTTGDIIVILDSDDYILPDHFRKYAEAFSKQPELEWVRISPTFYADKWKIRNTFDGWCNSVAFRKSAWQKVGGYSDALSVGEDRQFVGKLSEKCKGTGLLLPDEQITAIYNWGTGTYHISGLGDDGKGKIPAYQRALADFELKIKSRVEPSGVINLQPKLEHDPMGMVREFLAEKKIEIKQDAVALVYLGRYGDIINVLPIAQHIHNTYGKPYFVVAREFASVLDGVSYVTPFPVSLHFDQLNEALAIARRHFAHVINCQVYGRNYKQERHTASYNKEAWSVAGFGYMFDEFERTPLFDQRNLDEEAKLYAKLNPTARPMILVNTKSHSSPFDRRTDLLKALESRWGKDYLILPVCDLVAHHVYDLLGLIDRATVAVTVDTMIIHLAACCNTPTVALVNPKPWLGTIPRFDHCDALTYDNVKADFDSLHEAIARAIHAPRPPPVKPMPVVEAPKRTIFHALERHEDGSGEKIRKQPAVMSWDRLYRDGVVPCHYWEYKRNARMTIRDKRELPYLKDVLEAAMQKAGDEDIIMWSNDDNYLHPELPKMLRLHCSLWGVVSSQRCEFRGAMPGPLTKPEGFASQGQHHMGRDIFAFTKRWLIDHWQEIPDFILGASDFDLALACMIRLQWGVRTNRQNIEKSIWPCELHRGYVSHKFHPPKWGAPNNVSLAPSQIVNRNLFRAWARKHLPELRFHVNNTI